jgi:restriction system protein
MRAASQQPLLEEIGFEDVRVTQYSGDGGIDVEATLTVGGVTRVKTAIQVKRFRERNNIRVNVVRELRGSLVTDQRGLIISTSGFAKEPSRRQTPTGRRPSASSTASGWYSS